MFTSLIIMVLSIIAITVISHLYITVDQIEIDMWNTRANNNLYWLHNKQQSREWRKEKSSAIVLQHITEPVEDNTSEDNTSGDAEGAPGVWHDKVARDVLVATVWAYSVYAQRGGIMNGTVDPTNLDPRKLPRAEQAEKEGQENMINTIKLMVRLGEMGYEIYLDIKWSVKQAYYKHKSDRARDITPGCPRTLRGTTTGAATTPVAVGSYSYHTSVQ